MHQRQKPPVLLLARNRGFSSSTSRLKFEYRMTASCFWQVNGVKPNKVTFKSHLLGGFGVGFVTPVNLIDFNHVFRNFGKKLLSNPCVWATIIVTIVLYVLFAVIARRLDKKDAQKVTAFHLLIINLNHNNTATSIYYWLQLPPAVLLQCFIFFYSLYFRAWKNFRVFPSLIRLIIAISPLQ